MNPLRSLAWTWLKTKIRKQFPTVKAISTGELATWLSQSKTQPILLDVRRADEFEVSHLHNARHVPNLDSVLKATLPLDAPIVVYCSVGYCSARLASQLQDVGFSQIYNLEGSIFQWVNEGRPVLRGQSITNQVHPYNRLWGLLLEPRAIRQP